MLSDEDSRYQEGMSLQEFRATIIDFLELEEYDSLRKWVLCSDYIYEDEMYIDEFLDVVKDYDAAALGNIVEMIADLKKNREYWRTMEKIQNEGMQES